MAGPTREQVYDALFTLCGTVIDFKTKSRRFRMPANVGIGDMPAMFMIQVLERAQPQRNLPTIWRLQVDLILMMNVADPNVVPASLFNPVVDALCVKLAPVPPSDVQTLGGLVQHCWIEGDVEIYDGSITDQAICVVPIVILVPGLV